MGQSIVPRRDICTVWSREDEITVQSLEVNTGTTDVGIIRGNQRGRGERGAGRGLLSGDYAVPANLIENSRCESRIRASSHAWPKLSSLDDWQPGRKRYALVRVCEDYSRPYTRRRNIDFPFIAPRRHGETREIAPNRKSGTFYLSLLI